MGMQQSSEVACGAISSSVTREDSMKRLSVVFGALLLAVGATMFGGAPAALATGTGCNPDPFSQVQECTTVVGSGLRISSISGWTVNNTSSTFDNLHIEIYGPQGHLGNCNVFSLGNLATGPTCVWRNPSPLVDRVGGDYCSRVWQLFNGRYTVGSSECVNVHR
jgi:hypothetical protein